MKAALRFALCALGFTIPLGCNDAPEEEAPVIRPVRYTQVFSGAAGRVRSFSGSAQASMESRLSFKVPGTIQRLDVTVGAQVRSGQVLAALDPKDFELQVEQTAASHEQALAQQRNAEADYRRVSALYENNNASRDQLDGARAAKESADAQVRALANSLELARLQRSYTELKAPVDGQVMSVPAEVNENVGAGQVVLMLSAGAAPEVVVGLPEGLISQVREGDRVQVTFDALGDQEFAAVVTEVAIASSAATSTYQVTARLDADNGDVRSGMACEVAFQFEGGASTSFVLPSVAVAEDRNGRYVFVVELGESEQGTARRRNVEVGALTSDGLEILSGVTDGDLVVTAGVSRIVDGQTVRLLAR